MLLARIFVRLQLSDQWLDPYSETSAKPKNFEDDAYATAGNFGLSGLVIPVTALK